MNFSGQDAIINYHRSMLADRTRTEALQKAIHRAVQPGDVVLDLGCGTGVLSYFACQAGARRVYAIEAGRALDLAKVLARANRFEDRITFIEAHSLQAEVEERADVLITETLWNFGIGEGMLRSVADARRRLLKPMAKIIPAAVDMIVGLFEVPELYGALSDWPAERYGLDLSPVRPFALNNFARRSCRGTRSWEHRSGCDTSISRPSTRPISTAPSRRGWSGREPCTGSEDGSRPSSARESC